MSSVSVTIRTTIRSRQGNGVVISSLHLHLRLPMRALFLGLVPLAIASALPLSGQAPSANPAAAVRAAQEFVNHNGTMRFTFEEDDVQVTHRFTIRTIGACRISVEEDLDLGPSRTRSKTTLDLARLSPEMEIAVIREEVEEPGGPEEMHRLVMVTSSGDSTISTSTSTSFIGIEGSRSTDQVEFALWFLSPAVAEEARQRLARAIRECGGTPPTPEAQRKIAAGYLYEAGNDAPTVALKGTCREMVAGLFGSGTPEFSSDSSFTVVREGNGEPLLKITGDVQVSGERRTFTCRFRREGDTYVPFGRAFLDGEAILQDYPVQISSEQVAMVAAGTRGGG
jgi:hypothetical protein